jgi:hypothetical protein
MATDAQKARVRDAFAVEIFNVDDDVRDERILDAVNAISFWTCAGSSISGIHMTKACSALIQGELFWLGAIPASSVNRTGLFTVDLYIQKPNLTGVLGAPMAQVIESQWEVNFTSTGGCGPVTHIPYIHIQS